MDHETSIIIPAHNEEGNLRPLLDSILGLEALERYSYEVIIVDDHSADGTAGICDDYSGRFNNVKAIHRSGEGRGMGLALKAGTRSSRGKFIIWVMADRSDDLEAIPRLIERLKGSDDMVFCSRYMKGGSRGTLDPVKAFLSSRYTVMAKIIFGIKVHDITNAFRGFKREVFDSLRLESKDFAISPEMAIKAHLLGFKLGEIPTSYCNRTAGKTKFVIPLMTLKYLALFKYRFYDRKDIARETFLRKEGAV